MYASSSGVIQLNYCIHPYMHMYTCMYGCIHTIIPPNAQINLSTYQPTYLPTYLQNNERSPDSVIFDPEQHQI